jgi:hypothetical protein
MRLRGLVLAFLVVGLIPLAAQPALADSVDFSGAAGGSFSWAGGLGSTFTAMSGLVSAQRVPGGLAIPLVPNAAINFTTGAFLGSPMPGMFNFGGGGPVTVGNSSLCGGSGNCFTGIFTSGQILFNAAGGTATFVGNFIAGSLSAALETLLGFPPGTNTNATGSISASFLANPPGLSGLTGGTGSWVSGDLVLTPNPISEPGMLTLLGAGLIGLAALVRRRGFGSLATRT